MAIVSVTVRLSADHRRLREESVLSLLYSFTKRIRSTHVLKSELLSHQVKTYQAQVYS